MKQLQKWIQIVQGNNTNDIVLTDLIVYCCIDDYLQTSGLQAIKKCVLRSKTWLSGLETILKEYRKSPVPEKQEISRELIVLLQDTQFEKELQETTDLTVSNVKR
jgi:hypothetical protein